jgi:YebC/PmpR family DNA-binding regulatory protein
MPGDNIQRAIQKGEGTLEGSQLTEATYEGYGAGGAAVIVEVVSDNKNRTVQEIRSAFTRSGGNLGENGSVAWMFDTCGVIGVSAEGKDIDEFSLQVIDAGAEDIAPQGDYIEIYTTPSELEKVRKALEAQGVEISSAEVRRVPKTTCTLDEHTAFQVLRLLDKLEEMDDVQKVDSNVDFTDEILEKFEAQAK